MNQITNQPLKKRSVLLPLLLSLLSLTIQPVQNKNPISVPKMRPPICSGPVRPVKIWPEPSKVN